MPGMLMKASMIAPSCTSSGCGSGLQRLPYELTGDAREDVHEGLSLRRAIPFTGKPWLFASASHAPRSADGTHWQHAVAVTSCHPHTSLIVRRTRIGFPVART